MLFVPWRDEEDQLLKIDHENTYSVNRDLISKNREKYFFYEDTYLQAVQDEVEMSRLKEYYESDDMIDQSQENIEFSILQSIHEESELFSEDQHSRKTLTRTSKSKEMSERCVI